MFFSEERITTQLHENYYEFVASLCDRARDQVAKSQKANHKTTKSAPKRRYLHADSNSRHLPHLPYLRCASQLGCASKLGGRRRSSSPRCATARATRFTPLKNLISFCNYLTILILEEKITTQLHENYYAHETCYTAGPY